MRVKRDKLTTWRPILTVLVLVRIVFLLRFRTESINALEEYRRSLSQTYDDFDLMVDNVPLAIREVNYPQFFLKTFPYYFLNLVPKSHGTLVVK